VRGARCPDTREARTGMSQLSVQIPGSREVPAQVASPSPSASSAGVPSPAASHLSSPVPQTPMLSRRAAVAEHPDRSCTSAKPQAHEGESKQESKQESKGTVMMPWPARANKEYMCIESCGAGSYGEVYKAVRRCDGQLIALKVLEGDKWALEEASILRQLDHEYICKLYDCFECPEEGVACLAMEYASGGDLLERITNSGALTEPTAVELCKQILEALQHMHTKGVVHRDLKPENVLYSDNGKPLLADFGVGKRLRASVPPEDPVESLLTGGRARTGIAEAGLRHLSISDAQLRTHTQQIGTLGYSAPEVNSDEGHSFAADIWSLGAMFYVLLCGYHPFDMGDDEPHVIQERVRTGNVLSMEGEAWLSISEEAKDFVSRCLTVDVGQRATLQDCLCHPWLSKDFMKTEVVELVDAFARLQVYRSCRRESRSMAAAQAATRVKRKRETSVASDEGSTGSLTPTPSKNFKAVMRDQCLPSTAEISLSESLDLSLSDGEGDPVRDPATAASSSSSFSSSGNAAHIRTGSAAASAVPYTPVGSEGGRGGAGPTSLRVGAGSLVAPDIRGIGIGIGIEQPAGRVPPTPLKHTPQNSALTGGAEWRYSGEKEKGQERDRIERALDKEGYRERKRVHSVQGGVHSVQDASPSALSPDSGEGVRGGAGMRVQDGGDGHRCARTPSRPISSFGVGAGRHVGEDGREAAEENADGQDGLRHKVCAFSLSWAQEGVQEPVRPMPTC
jgi:serine/threonine protein kinase